MRETTIRGARVPGSIPGGGSKENPIDSNTSSIHTEQCSVENAKVLSPHRIACPFKHGDVVEVLISGQWRRGMVMRASTNEAGDGTVDAIECGRSVGLRYGFGPGEWRWPVYSATTRCEGCGDYKPCACTHGKNGVPPLETIPEEEEQPSDKQPPSPPLARWCIGVPPYQGPGEACNAVLGPEVVGDRCAVCAVWMGACGECDGCNASVPGWKVTGKLCGDCKRLRRCYVDAWAVLAKRRSETSQSFEIAWRELSERSDVDLVTVTACKQLRDLEVGHED